MKFILRRLAFYAVAAWVALTLNFFIPRLMPGNAVEAIMSKFPNLQPSAYRALEAMLGVGHPGSLWNQYLSYLDDVVHLNFGTDVMEYPANVSTLLAQTIPWTLTLVGTATVIAFFLGTGLGIVAGWRHGGWSDRLLPGLMFLQAIPYFFLALILVEVLSEALHLFPLGQGYANGLIPGWNGAFIGSAIYHSLLPAFTIVMTRVVALGRMCAGKTPRLATPTDPQSTTVVTPDRTPMSSGSHMPIPTPSVIAPAATCVCRSISPGTTCRPAPWISTTRCASSGGMPAAIFVILPSVIAISRMLSIPWPGSSTWPPLISRS